MMAPSVTEDFYVRYVRYGKNTVLEPSFLSNVPSMNFHVLPNKTTHLGIIENLTSSGSEYIMIRALIGPKFSGAWGPPVKFPGDPIYFWRT